MDLQTMISEARKGFGETDSNNSHVSNSELTTWANEAYRRICVLIESVPITERSYDSPASATPTITLNAGTVSIDQVKMKMQPENEWVDLKVGDLKDLFAIDPDFENATAGKPEWLIRTGTFTARLYPPPNTANASQTSAIKTYGLESPTSLSADGDTPDLPIMLHDIIPYWMAAKAFLRLGRVDAAAGQFQLFNGFLRDYKHPARNFSEGRGWRWPGRRSTYRGPSIFDGE